MTSQQKHTLRDAEHQAAIHELLQEQMRLKIRLTFITVLEEEVNGFIQAALYQRTPERQDYRNGHYERDLVPTSGKIEDFPVPRTRGGFHTQLFEHYQCRQAELDEAICDMFVQGVSTSKVGEVVAALTGNHPSPSTVSRVFHTLEGEFEGWKTRPLQAHYLYAFADVKDEFRSHKITGLKSPLFIN